MPRIVDIDARVETDRISISVTAAAGGAGQVVEYASTTRKATILNGSNHSVDMKIADENWVRLRRGQSETLWIDLRSDVVRLRQAPDTPGPVSIDILIEMPPQGIYVDGLIAGDVIALAALIGTGATTLASLCGAPVRQSGVDVFTLTQSASASGLAILQGQVLSVPSGVVLTLSEPPTVTARHAVIRGAGTVVISSGDYDVSWYEGNSVDQKWNLLRRGLTTNRRYNVRFPRPRVFDPAAINVSALGGWVWRADAPVIFGDPENLGSVDLHCGIASYSAISSIIQLGDISGNKKTEGISFVRDVELYSDGSALRGMEIAGAGHINAPRIAAWGCQTALDIHSGQGSEMGINDITIPRLYAARYSDVPVKIRGSNDVKTFDVKVLASSFDGASTNAVANLFAINGACRGIDIAADNNPTLQASLYDVTGPLIQVDTDPTSTSGVEGLTIQKISNQAATGSKKYLDVAKSFAGASVHRGIRVLSAWSRSAPTSTDAFSVTGADDVLILGSRTDKITLGSTSTTVSLVGFERSNVVTSGAMPSVNGSVQRVFSLADGVTSGTTIPIFLRTGALFFVTISSAGAVDSCLVSTRTDGSNGITIVANASGLFTITPATASKVNLSVSNGTLSVQNMTGVTKSVVIETNY